MIDDPARNPMSCGPNAAAVRLRIPTMDCATEEGEIRQAMGVEGLGSQRFQVASRTVEITGFAAVPRPGNRDHCRAGIRAAAHRRRHWRANRCRCRQLICGGLRGFVWVKVVV